MISKMMRMMIMAMMRMMIMIIITTRMMMVVMILVRLLPPMMLRMTKLCLGQNCECLLWIVPMMIMFTMLHIKSAVLDGVGSGVNVDDDV